MHEHRFARNDRRRARMAVLRMNRGRLVHGENLALPRDLTRMGVHGDRSQRQSLVSRHSGGQEHFAVCDGGR